MSSNQGQLYLRVAIQVMFIIHSATLLYHLPFLVRSEPRGLQHKFQRKTFDEIRDSLSDWLFRRAYRMTKSSFDLLYAII